MRDRNDHPQRMPRTLCVYVVAASRGYGATKAAGIPTNATFHDNLGRFLQRVRMERNSREIFVRFDTATKGEISSALTTSLGSPTPSSNLCLSITKLNFQEEVKRWRTYIILALTELVNCKINR